MKLGIDFGSTYSTVSKYDPQTDGVKPLSISEGSSFSIPSVVSISKKGVISCGTAAKDQVGKKTVQIFEAFKMLLNEPDEYMRRRRGYSGVYSPRLMTQYFLKNVLSAISHREGFEKVEELVICVPEVWEKRPNTMDGRLILRDVLKNDLGIPVGHIRVVTEPEAASAFIAYHYEQQTHKRYQGHLLLIDYGGGTLDLTLTQVASDGNGVMEIRYRGSGGAGENHPDSQGGGDIGTAGIAFMQRVVMLALMEQGLASDPVCYTAPEFLAAVKELESQMKAAERIREIEEVFGSFGGYRSIRKILQQTPEEFISLEYGGEEVQVTYQHLYMAYRDVIEGVLDREIGKMNLLVKEEIRRDPCDPASGNQEDFKIALVGGFSSFYLVRQQIAQIYNLDPDQQVDLRVKNVCADQQEQAISLGAALLAAGKVKLQRTARYSIGIHTVCSDGTSRLSYGIKFNQVIEPGKPYYLCRQDDLPDVPENRIVYGGLYGNIRAFAIEYSHRTDHGGLMNLKPEMLSRLRQLPQHNFWNLGFSMDDSDVVSFHILSRTLLGPEKPCREIVIPLDSYGRMFDLTDVKEVTIS